MSDWARRGKVIDLIAGAAGKVNVVLDLFEVKAPPGPDQAAALADVAAASVSSLYQGETYWGVPYPGAPEMLVLGQDVIVAAIDLGIGLSTLSAGALMSEPTAGVSLVVHRAMDACISGLSAAHDTARNFGLLQSYGAVGIYRDQDGAWRLVSLDYSPAGYGEETEHIGVDLTPYLLGGGDYEPQ